MIKVSASALLIPFLLGSAVSNSAAGEETVESLVAAGACGSLHVQVTSVALPDIVNSPPHSEILDQTWATPVGAYNQYRHADGWIVTQGWPSNGGSHSHERLSTDCKVIASGENLPAVQLKTVATSDLNSGFGHGAAASSDYNTTWFSTRVLPSNPGTKGWALSALGIVNSSGTHPDCEIRINDGAPIKLPTGPFIKTFPNLTGVIATFVGCKQGHIAAFPTGAGPTTAIVTVETDVTLSFSRQ